MAVEANGTFLIDSAVKCVEWERAKGHLRALVALQGSYSGGATDKWQELDKRVKAFITQVEDHGLDE